MSLQNINSVGVLSAEDYNKLIEHINEIDRILSKYEYLSRRCIDNILKENNNVNDK